MSSHKRRVVFSQAASDDLRDIVQYTIRNWGDEQSRRYERAIRTEIRRLSAYPYLGRERREFGPTSRSLRINEHIAIYDVDDDKIVVQQIVHAKSDWLKEP